jgi:hypothetical protein
MDTPESSENNRPPTEKTELSVSGNGGAAPFGVDDGQLPTNRPEGGVIAGLGSGLSSLFSQSLSADVSKEMQDLAPTFGDVLLSIGTGVAESQAQLDAGLVDTAKHLSKTTIDVVTDVIQVLDDDGLPDVSKSTLVTSNVSLINFVNPTVHEWKHVALSMDLTVGAMDNESGLSFNHTQINTGGRGAYYWGYAGWFAADYRQSSEAGFTRSRQETDWASGQIRLDALLAPRETTKFPVPAEIAIGPTITFAQGSVKEIKAGTVVTGRSLDIIINVHRKNGSPHPTAMLDAETDRFAYSWAKDTTLPIPWNGNQTNSQGQAKLTVTRDIPSQSFLSPVKVRVFLTLGAITKELDVIL